MKLEVGMYCRYNNFQNKIKIAKIKGIQKADEVFQYDYINFDNDDGELETNIIKASHRIIDLIEEGDYVNGAEVVDTKYLNWKGILFITVDGAISYGWGNGEIPENEIKSIVTKEMMESVMYYVK